MKKQLLTIFALSSAIFATAQVGINTTTPAATFDVTAKTSTGTTTTPEGLIIPRVDRQRAQSMTSVATSTLIYVNDVTTGTLGGTAVNIDAAGFYYYNGSVWTKLNAGGVDTSIYVGDGALAGNRIVSQNANTLAFTGTATNAFSVDGTTLSVDAANNRTGFGTAAPLETVQVLGSSKFGRTGTNSIIIDGMAPTPLSTNGLIASSAKNGGILYSEADVNVGILNSQQMNILSGGTDFSSDKILDKVVASFQAAGRAGINTDAPTATVDINAAQPTGTATTVDGILIPRVDRQRAGSMTAVPVSTLIYINNVANGALSGSTQFVDAVGFYYNDGTNWIKLGASTATSALNVTSELDVNYTALATDDIILFTTTTSRELTLPTSGVAIGKRYYVSVLGPGGVPLKPDSAIRNTSYNYINAGTSATIMYLGGGKWDIISGY